MQYEITKRDMEKVLGLDLGTNSIGWAVIEREEGKCRLVDQGVNIFKDGVAYEKGIEKPAVKERTEARASRRHYFRRRLRKIALLKILVDEKLCPPLAPEALSEWRAHKKYPMDADFISWQRTDDNLDKNPYHDRAICLEKKLDLQKKADRYILGRALYHLAQRRGFLSNRKNASEGDDGKVKTGISELSERMLEANCQYLGEYFYKLYQEGGKIRTKYTDRTAHLKAEFDAICQKQELSQDLTEKLRKAIFYQRPLKSQKGLVGKCTLETNRNRCQVSHPRFEEFRMWSFINNIRVKSFADDDYRPLSSKETEAILPLFFRKSADTFNFEDIAKKIAGKGNYAFKGDETDAGYRFNYYKDTTVSGCPVTASIISAFNTTYGDMAADVSEVYLKGDGKSQDQILNDLWHSLVTFDSEDMLVAWLVGNFQLDNKSATSLAKTRLSQGYASLSLKAIGNILPYLKEGRRYDEAVFMGNLRKVLKISGEGEDRLRTAEQWVVQELDDFSYNPLNKKTTKENVIHDRLMESMNISASACRHLYHPSMIETYPAAQPDENGLVLLGSPRISAVRNPMAMRALFRLRILVNRLLKEGKIDRNTKINIEFARELNDTNRRAATARYQRELEKEYAGYKKELLEMCVGDLDSSTMISDTDLLKYKLWKEQNGKCLYTGKTIGVADFIGDGNTFDIEHTVPRSRGGDDAQVNKTLCENYFNRSVKKSKLPSELSNHDEIMERVKALGWEDKIETLRKDIEKQKKRAKAADTKEAKDSAIQQRHYLQMKLDYWKGKMSRFTMEEVPNGFENRQGVDIGIIGKYARLYLGTVFSRIYTVKGATTAEFRKMWGLQDEYAKKERINHVHHCIDAITIACIGKNEYDRWAQYRKDTEKYLWYNGSKPKFDKPWDSFTQDVKAIADGLLIYHYSADNMSKQSKKVFKIRGVVQRAEDGKALYVQGDTARGSLHQDTFYGAIEKDGKINYVIRKSLDSLEEKDINNIVDDVVREKILSAVKNKGLKAAVAEGIWMNEEKGIPIKKVRLYARSITSPIHLKKHRDVSAKEYKRDYHVANDGNYCMAIYGEEKPSFKIVNNLEAARFFNGKIGESTIVPMADEKGRPVRCILKIGTTVLFYQDSPSEIDLQDTADLSRRMYVVTGFSVSSVKRPNGKVDYYGLSTFRHHQEARKASELTAKKGTWTNDEAYRPIIAMLHTQFRAIVQGNDFTIKEDGTIQLI